MFRRIVILTGAGISQESGLHTFRDPDGLWSRVRIEDVATPAAFARDAARVHGFYNARRAQLASVHPNAAHVALARLEREFGGDLLVLTQNIDDLHERAGSTKLLHMHGELRRVRCTACGNNPRWDGDTGTDVPCPACGQHALRPDVVWFGEMPLHMEAIEAALAVCDLFVSIGTSGTVYPAAGFVDAARRAQTIELDLAPDPASRFERSIEGFATNTVPHLVDELLHP
ncbi:NAD-dependent deacylase [Lichenicoccus roseus]|uniref:NAD-dependent protein deacylase n=1 Tax=Lichenicoccus roseus TaxID=2683649 RepID=A0A5R9J868_9PROT|nr:NAD-dependent deacylase [Lichenicoccus roseus]TLU73810.1 NAD-dependent deacylase [Lichenicoccus roseus]